MILIVGATGILGGMITQRLLESGKEVRILVRHNSPAEELAKQRMATSPQLLIEAGAQPVYGDLKDRASLDQACQGIETVITTANSAMRGGEDNVDTVDRHGNRNLIEAARAAGVKQFIFISFLGANLNHPVPLFKAKAEKLRPVFVDILYRAVLRHQKYDTVCHVCEIFIKLRHFFHIGLTQCK